MMRSNRANEIAQLWIKTALTCLAGDDRCFEGGSVGASGKSSGDGDGGGSGGRRPSGTVRGVKVASGRGVRSSGPADSAEYEAANSLSFVVREVGFVLLTRAVSFSFSSTGSNPSSRAGRLGMRLHVVLTSRVHDVLGTLLAKPTADAALLRLASQWLVTKYYREFCYEDEDADLMRFLVDAAISDDRDLGTAASDLIIKITVTNISIKSLRSLCDRLQVGMGKPLSGAAKIKLMKAAFLNPGLTTVHYPYHYPYHYPHHYPYP